MFGPDIRRRLRSSAAPGCGRLAWLLAGLLAACAWGDVHVEIDGVRLAVTMQGEHPYVALGAFAAARALEFEYSYIDDVYVLRNPDAEGRAAVMTFKPGSASVVVDDETRTLAVPPIEGKAGLLVPLRDFAALVLDPAAAAQLELRADEGTGSSLKGIVHAVRSGFTKVVFSFQGTPQATVNQYPDRHEAELVFEGCRLAGTFPPLELGTPEVTRISVTESPQLLQVRVAVALAAPVRIEAVFVTNLGEYAVTFRTDSSPGGLAWDVPDRLGDADRALLSGRRVAIDPGHGGTDRGAVGSGGREEKVLALAAGRELAQLLKATGIDATLVRPEDKQVPSRTRVHALNRGGFAAVVSLHARSSEASQASTTPYLFVLPLDTEPGAVTTTSTSPPVLLWADCPDPTERTRSRQLAESIAEATASLLGTRAEIIPDPQILPLRRALAPGVVVDLGPLEAFADPVDPSFERDPVRRRVVFAIYRGLLGYLLGSRKGHLPSPRSLR